MSDLVDKFIHRYSRLPTERDPDYLEMLRMSKYRIVSVPDVQPGKCANCGASKQDGRKYVDFGLQVDWYGAVMLCTLCLKDIAYSAGLFDELAFELKKAKDKALELQNLWELGKTLEKGLNEGFEGVKEYFDRLSALGFHFSAGHSSNTEPSEESSKQAVGEGDNPADAAKPRVAKSAPSSRPKDLPSLAERLKAATGD